MTGLLKRGETIGNRAYATTYPEVRIPLTIVGGQLYELVDTVNVKSGGAVDLEQYIERTSIEFTKASNLIMPKRLVGKILDESMW